jgi:hypothetical protein
MNADWLITIVFVTWAVSTAAGVGVLIGTSVRSSHEPDGVAAEPRTVA